MSVALFYISKLQEILGILTTLQDTVDNIKVPINESIKKISTTSLNDLVALINKYGSENSEKIKSLLAQHGFNISH